MVIFLAKSRLMAKFLLLVVCLTAGVALRRTRFFDAKSALVLNNLLIYFFIPVLSLYHVPKIEFAIEQAWLSVTPFMVFFASFAFFKVMGRLRNYDRSTEGALIMCSGIGSISFVGFPIFELLYGPEGLAYGLILSLAGTFMVFNTVGISTGFYYANEGRQTIGFFLRKMFRFPPFVAFALASLLNVVGYSYPLWMDGLLQSLAAPFSVLALLAIGMQIEFSLDRSFLNKLLLGQLFKLLLAPLFIYLFLWYVVGVDDLVGRICVLGAAIGSMNAISIVAAQLGLNPKLAMLMPAIGIPISIPLLFLWDWMMG